MYKALFYSISVYFNSKGEKKCPFEIFFPFPQEKVNTERFKKTGCFNSGVQRRERGAGSEQTEQQWDRTGQAGFL